MFVYTACDFELHWSMLIAKLTPLVLVDEVYTTSIRVPNLYLYWAESLSPELLAAPFPVQPVMCHIPCWLQGMHCWLLFNFPTRNTFSFKPSCCCSWLMASAVAWDYFVSGLDFVALKFTGPLSSHFSNLSISPWRATLPAKILTALTKLVSSPNLMEVRPLPSSS